MPIHDLGYREWDRKRAPASLRWWVIAQNGIRLAWKSLWLRRMIIAAWTPAIAYGFVFFFYEQMCVDVQDNPNEAIYWDQTRVMFQGGLKEGFEGNMQRRRFGPFGAFLDLVPEHVLMAALEDPEQARHDVWGLLLLRFFQYSQGFLMVLLVGLVAPQLISTDIRSRAFLAYFSRPINRVGYILGKSFVVWFYLLLITTGPALVLYIIGVGLSPDWTVVFDTWDLPLYILIASAFLVIPATALSLMFSSLTSETRYAQYAWYAVWTLGFVAFYVLGLTGDNWYEVSFFHIFRQVQEAIFGFETWANVSGPLIVLIAITVGSLVILNRKVSAPMRI